MLNPGVADFPELAARGQAWGRNAYLRDGRRLVMEWSDMVTLAAVLLDGLPRPVSTEIELAAVIRGDRV
ncbi:hypothetical protein [Kitasatospora viridis]|uniref:hypothetical protein n=1 Tax=Kitasatospora viridis TaxID=281105 RepID=UPI0011A86C6D|nr:hypothetical protein [Kitasatospora viridis]